MIDTSTIVTLVFAAFVVFGFLGGFMSGFARQVLKIICAAVAIAAAFYVTGYISENILSTITPEYIISLLEANSAQNEAIAQFIPYLSSWDWFMQLSISTLLSPAVFSIALVVLWLVSKVAHAILCLVLGIGRGFNPTDKLLGAILGTVEGFLIAFIIFVPVSGFANIADNGVDAIRENNTDGQYTEIIEFYDDNISPVTNHEIVKFVYDNGGKYILDTFAVVEVEGEKVNLIDEGSTLLSMILEATALKDVDFTAPSADNQEIIRSIVDELDKSDYISSVISNLLSDIGGALENDAFPVEIPAPFDSIAHSAVTVLETSTRDNLHGDLVTVLDVYFLLTDSGAFKAFGTEGGEADMENALIERDENGKTLISKLVEILNKNERTSALVKTLTEMAITMLAGELGGDEYNVAEVYTEIKTGFNEILAINEDDYTPEEYEAVRDEKIDSVLTENGIELDDETINQLGDFIDDNLSDKDELTDEDINSVLLHYFEVISSGEAGAPVLP